MMYVEQRIEELERQVSELSDKVKNLEMIGNERWLSAKEIAELMNCSVNNIYIRIRSGEIYATRILGSPRIPISQFYKQSVGKDDTKKVRNREDKRKGIRKELCIKSMIDHSNDLSKIIR